MPLYDMPLAELQEYKPRFTKEPDFDPYWQTAKAELAGVPMNVMRVAVDYPVEHVKVFELTFDSLFSAKIKGFYAFPTFQA